MSEFEENIIKLINKHPNDTDLGNVIRKLFFNNRDWINIIEWVDSVSDEIEDVKRGLSF